MDLGLHGVLLVAQGMSCPEVSCLLGDSPRTVEYWVRRFEDKGLAGLVEGERSGRPRRLNDEQLKEIKPGAAAKAKVCGDHQRPLGWQRTGRLH